MKKLFAILAVFGIGTTTGAGVYVFGQDYKHTPSIVRPLTLFATTGEPGTPPPIPTTAGTFRGAGFTTVQQEYLGFRVPLGWDGETDVKLSLTWGASTPIAHGETVIWSAYYRSITPGTALDFGDVAIATGTHVQVGGGVALQSYTTWITIAHDHDDQPLTVGSLVGIRLELDDAGQTYTGAAVLLAPGGIYLSNKPVLR